MTRAIAETIAPARAFSLRLSLGRSFRQLLGSERHTRIQASGRPAICMITLISALIIGGCGKNEGGSPPASGTVKVADVPSPDQCMRPVQQTGTTWTPYQSHGFVPYNWSSWSYSGSASWSYYWSYGSGSNAQLGYPGYAGTGSVNPTAAYGTTRPINSTGSFNGCPSGFTAACDSRVGLSCIPNQQLYNFNNLAWYGWQSGANQFSFCGYAGYGGGLYGCGMSLIQSCWVGTPSCGYGYCQPLQYGSAIGVCVL